MNDLSTIAAMARALRALADLSDAQARAAAYAAARVGAGDAARLDRHALTAETARRALFPAARARR